MNLKRILPNLAAVALVAAWLVAPASVSATSVANGADYSHYSVAQLEQLISKLQKQLADMKKGSLCFVSDHDLSIGDGDAEELTSDVRRFQDFLQEKGHFKYKSTGYFGKATRASTVAFQRASGLQPTGEFDAATRAKAHSLYCLKVRKPEAQAVKKVETKTEPSLPASGAVKSISLTASGAVVRWTVDGHSANGFKVVWSKNSGPTYPTREDDRYVFLSDPSASEATLDAFNGPGTYHVRVCEYVGGCGRYSNEVTTGL